MAKRLAPVWLWQPKPHHGLSLHGSVPFISGGDTPRRFRRTKMIGGSVQAQSLIARPSSERTTQFASTAPPSMGTQETATAARLRNRMRFIAVFPSQPLPSSVSLSITSLGSTGSPNGPTKES
jgi:hypothetical protein